MKTTYKIETEFNALKRVPGLSCAGFPYRFLYQDRSLPMRIRLASLLLSPLLACGLHVPSAWADTTVPSLDKARGAIQTEDARRMYDGQMSGAPQPDRLGVALPDGFTRDFLVQQLAPGLDPKRLLVAGVKPWGQRPGTFVAMVCLASTPERAARLIKFGGGECADLSSDDDKNGAWFGVFGTTPGKAPTLLARTDGPVKTPTDWRNTNIDLPQDLATEDANAPLLSMPTEWKHFDLAAYKIAPGAVAFGVRAGWSEGYSGGGANFEALYLFHIDGPTLRVVFAQPMSFFKSIAGDWHPDGTRDHDMSDASNILVVLPEKTDGYFDLQLRQQGGKWRKTLKWSAVERGYR